MSPETQMSGAAPWQAGGPGDGVKQPACRAGAPRPREGLAPRLARGDPAGRSPQGEIKIPDTLVEVLKDAASDAGSTPAASTNSPRVSYSRTCCWPAASLW